MQHTITLSSDELTLVLTALYILGQDEVLDVTGVPELINRLEVVEEGADHAEVA